MSIVFVMQGKFLFSDISRLALVIGICISHFKYICIDLKMVTKINLLLICIIVNTECQ